MKIGKSIRPTGRESWLKTGAPYGLRTLKVIPGYSDVEVGWHQRWDHLRLHGEWFKLTPELLAAIEAHASI